MGFPNRTFYYYYFLGLSLRYRKGYEACMLEAGSARYVNARQA